MAAGADEAAGGPGGREMRKHAEFRPVPQSPGCPTGVLFLGSSLDAVFVDPPL